MQFRRMKYFLVLSETLNYTKAAEKLFISPQALARQIVLLEEELGAKLFERTTRKVKLTEIGRICKKEYTRINNDLDDTNERIKNIIKSIDNILKVGFFSEIPKKKIILPIINMIKDISPELEMEFLAGSMDEAKQMLHEDKADIVITIAHDYEDWIDYERVNLIVSPAKIVVAPSHKWADKKNIPEEEMKESSILLLEMNRPEEVDSFYQKYSDSKRNFAKNFTSMVTTLELGRDFAVFPKMFNDMYNMNLIYFDLPEKMRFNYRLMCVAKRDNPKKEVAVIMEGLKEESKNYTL